MWSSQWVREEGLALEDFGVLPDGLERLNAMVATSRVALTASFCDKGIGQ